MADTSEVLEAILEIIHLEHMGIDITDRYKIRHAPHSHPSPLTPHMCLHPSPLTLHPSPSTLHLQPHPRPPPSYALRSLTEECGRNGDVVCGPTCPACTVFTTRDSDALMSPNGSYKVSYNGPVSPTAPSADEFLYRIYVRYGK